MGTYIVEVEQQAMGAVIWTACIPSLKDLQLANVDVSLSIDCLPLLERDIGYMTGLGKEDHDYLSGSASQCLEFLQVGYHLGKARLKTAAWFPDYTGTQETDFMVMSQTRSDLSIHPGDDGGYNSSFLMKDSTHF